MIAAGFLLMAAAPAPAANQFEFDVQCMIATQQASGELEGALALATQLASMYYFGRVDSRLSGAELEPQLAAAARSVEGRPLGPLLEQCGEYMKTRGKVMEDLGEKLEVHQKARQIQ